MHNYPFFEIEEKWKKLWLERKIYRFKEGATNQEVFSVDTPPPTVIDKMHLGHSFGYTQLDFVARFKRMLGYNVFFPFGFDDNGLPTQALVEKSTGKKAEEMNRLEFIELCLKETHKFEEILKNEWISLGISADWDRYYSTIDSESRRVSQYSFIDLFKKDKVYLKEAPFFWCDTCKKAVSQKETNHLTEKVTFYNVRFKVDDKDDLIVSISRLEFLAGCVALFVNPNDLRYKDYVGKEAEVPIFKTKVPILTDKRISPKRGTGVKMCSTFADNFDVVLYLAHNLPLKNILDEQNKLNSLAREFEGMTVFDARNAILEKLQSLNLIESTSEGEIINRTHKECGSLVKYRSKKQWFVKTLELKDKLIDLGNQIKWHPMFMKKRFEKWVNSLEWDWNISRQRHFGVPFPVWYCEDCGNVILAKEQDLPVEPTIDKPPYTECPRCGSTKISPEKDVMDTWATSSLNPFVITNWLKDKGFFKKMFPLSLRVQSHDIIYTWLTYTLVKSYLHENSIPWKEVMIHGFVNDEEGKKLSLSKGNFKGVLELINSYGADAIRYWASCKNLGEDIVLDERYLRRAKKVMNKLWNATIVVKKIIKNYEKTNCIPKLRTIDKWLLYKLDQLIKNSTKNFEDYRFSDARRDVELFFIEDFANLYLELAKKDILENDSEITKAIAFTVYNSFLTILKLFAPIMPYITEEIYSQLFASKEGKESIHLSEWPKELKIAKVEDYDSGELFKDLIHEIRKLLHEKKVSSKNISKENVSIKLYFGNKKYLEMFQKIKGNIKQLLGIKNFEISDTKLKKESLVYHIGVELNVVS